MSGETTQQSAGAGIIEFLRSVGPASLASAAFAAGLVWAGMNAKVDTQAETIKELRASIARMAAAERVAMLELEHEKYVEVAEQRHRVRTQELTILVERVNAIAAELPRSKHRGRLEPIRPPMPERLR